MSDTQETPVSQSNQAESGNQSTENLETQESQEQVETQEATSSTEKEEIRSDAEIEADKSLSKKEKAEEKRLNKLKIKFMGKEMDEDLPFDIPDNPKAIEYMQKQIQMAKLSQHKSQEMATLEKQAIEFIQALKENPEAVLSDPRVGIDVKKLATQIIQKEIENAKKTPEQLELEKTQTELKRLKDQREKELRESKEREFQKLTEQYYRQYETQLIEALDKSGLPKSEIIVNRIADYLEEAALNKIDVSVADVIPVVKEEMKNNLKTLVASLTPEDLEEFIGKDILSNYRKSIVKKAKENQKVPTPLKASVKDVGQKGQEEKQDNPKKSFRDFFGV